MWREMKNLILSLITASALVGCSGGFKPTNATSNQTSPVAGMVVSNLSTSPGNVVSPNFQVSGPVVFGDDITLYTESSCSTAYASATYTSDPQTYGGGFLTDGIYYIHAEIVFNSTDGSTSFCFDTGVVHIVDTTNPADPSGFSLSSPLNASTSNDNTPIISGLVAGEIASTFELHSNPTCTNLLSSVLMLSPSVALNLTYATDGSDDGAKAYYAKIVDLAGNESNCTDLSLGYTLDTQGPTGESLTINAGGPYTTNVAATLNLSAIGADEMYITNVAGCSSGASWEAYNTTKPFTLTANATNNIYVKYRDNAGNETSCVGASIAHDTLAPNIVGGYALAGNATATDSDTTSWAAVTDNGPSGVAYYELAISTSTSDTNIIAGGAWSNIGLVTSHQVVGGLTLSDGTTYYTLVRAYDNAGNVSAYSASAGWSPADVTAPLDPIGWTMASPIPAVTTNDFTPEFSGSGIVGEDGAVARVYMNDGTCAAINEVGNETIAGGAFNITNVSLQTDGSDDGLNAFYGLIEDAAGNKSNCVDLSISYTLDTQGPTGVTIDIDAGATYASAAGVTLTIAATGAADMYITEVAGCGSGGVWEAFNTTKAFTLTNLNTTANVYIITRDANGNLSSCETDSIIHDDQAPDDVAGYSLLGDATQFVGDTTSWSVSNDNGPAGFSHYEIAISTSTAEGNIIASAPWLNIAAVTSYQYTATLAGATVYYTLVKAVDLAGNESNVTASAGWFAFLAPDQVQNLATASRSFDRIEISWTEPFDNLTPVSDYEIEYKQTSSGTWIAWDDGVTTDTNETITGLLESEEYDFRVRGYNGAWSIWSVVHTEETLINDPFFDPNAFKVINTGGSTASQVTSMEDGNVITLNGAPLTTLNTGDVFGFASSQFDVIEGTGRLFVGGRRGAGGNTAKGNIVWSPASWAGKRFLTNAIRTAPNVIMVYAFEAATVDIKQGGSTIQSQSLLAGGSHTFSVAPYGSYEVISDGFIVAYTMAVGGGGTNVVDPKPLLPPAKDLLGVPSNSAQLTTLSDGTNFNIYHSNTTIVSNSIDTGNSFTINRTGTNSYYQPNATRVIGNRKMIANSYADSNGNCAAPYIPSTMQRRKYATNVLTEWVAFVSTKPAVITIYPPGGGSSTLTLTRTGTDPSSPYKGYLAADQLAGTRFESGDRFAAWYEPKNDTNAANDDETIMFGWD
jgi:hypothetical protein